MLFFICLWIIIIIIAALIVKRDQKEAREFKKVINKHKTYISYEKEKSQKNDKKGKA